MNSDKSKVLIYRSLWLLGAMILSLFVIILRLYYLQVYLSDKYTILADDNRITTRILVPQRGIIYDRNGIAIAHNIKNFQALIVPEQAQNIDETLNKFSQIIPLSEDELKKIKKEIKKKRSFVPVKIKENLDWDTVSKVLLHSVEMPGIFIDEGLSRQYPYKEKMAHLLGYVSVVNDKDAKDNPLLDIPDFKIGRAGIEKMFEDKLRGVGGNLKLEVNAIGRIMKEIEKTEGIAGQNLNLTIDAELQSLSYDLLKDESGAVIVLDVHTGEVISFVSTPAYDPNKMSQGISTKDWQELLSNEKKPLSNKAISGQYSPGSTFKMITAIAGLETKDINPYKTTYCSGKMQLNAHTYHCWKREGHGNESLVEAIQHSCDIFFYEAGKKIGIDKIASVAKRFGLGKTTNLGFNNEKEGLIPTTEWKLGRYNETWRTGESVIASIGQGYILSTPIQLALMTAKLVNGGYDVKPSFTPLTDEEKQDIKKIKVSQKHLDLIKEGMHAVVNKEEGTAYWSRFNLDGQQMGGKTGTTQVKRISMQERQTRVLRQDELPWRLRNHALFVGYAPANNPKYAIAVVVEHGGSGSLKAAPVASKILKEALIIDKRNAKANENISDQKGK